MKVDFFFSSRRRHTRWPRDWSSDVCSSDLAEGDLQKVFGIIARESGELAVAEEHLQKAQQIAEKRHDQLLLAEEIGRASVGKSVELGGRRSMKKKKTNRQSQKTDD